MDMDIGESVEEDSEENEFDSDDYDLEHAAASFKYFGVGGGSGVGGELDEDEKLR